MDLGAFSDGTPIYIHPGILRSCDIVPRLPYSQQYSIIIDVITNQKEPKDVRSIRITCITLW